MGIMDDADYKNTRAHIDQILEERQNKIRFARQKIENESYL